MASDEKGLSLWAILLTEALKLAKADGLHVTVEQICEGDVLVVTLSGSRTEVELVEIPEIGAGPNLN